MASIKVKFRASVMQDKEGTLYYQVIHRRVVRQIKTNYRLFKWEWDNKNGCIVRPEIKPETKTEIKSKIKTEIKPKTKTVIKPEMKTEIKPKTKTEIKSEIKLETIPKVKTETKSSRYDLLNQIIENVNWEIQRLQEIIRNFEAKNCTYSTEDVVTTYFNSLKNEISVFDYVQKHITKLRQLGSPGTAENRETAFKSLINFLNRQDLKFSMLTAGMMEEYETYLRLRGNCRNTTSFYMRNLRSIYNRAVEDGLTTQANIFKRVYTGVDKTIKRAISMKDLRRIKELDLSAQPALEIARDLFLFSFYTRGMSFIDMAYLRKKEIVNGNLVYRRHKTGQQLSIQWEKEMQTIINKYPNSTSYLLPIITKEDGTEYRQYKNALMLTNRKLKKVAKLAHISTPLSMYASRHSWATIARDKKIPLSIISKGLGHDNDTNTQIYLASIKATEVDKANKKILKDLTGD